MKPTLFFIIYILLFQTQSYASGNSQANIGDNAIPKKAVFNGKMRNPVKPFIKVRVFDRLLSDTYQDYNVGVSKAGIFNFEAEVNEPTLVRMFYNTKEINLFVEPGDTFDMKSDGLAFVYGVEYFTDSRNAAQNTFFIEFRKEFGGFSDSFMFFELAKRSHTDYKRFVDKIYKDKWRFYHNYDQGKKNKFTPAFRDYIFAEIEYWKAFHLLSYHWEKKKLGGRYKNYYISPSYYDFLGNVSINNDSAIHSYYYRRFIKDFVRFSQEDLDPSVISKINQEHFVINVGEAKVYNGQSDRSALSTVFFGQKLKSLNSRSSFMVQKNIQGILKSDFWYKVRTKDGQDGWVHGGTGTLEKEEWKWDEATKTNALNYLSGKTLYYFKGNQLVYGLESGSLSNPEEAYQKFKKENPYPELDTWIDAEYESYQNGYAERAVITIDALEPEVVENATTEVVKKELPTWNKEKTTNSTGISAAESTNLDDDLKAELELMSQGYTPDEAKRIVRERKKERQEAKNINRFSRTVMESPYELYKAIDLKYNLPQTSTVKVKGRINNHNKAKQANLILYPNAVTMDEVVDALRMNKEGNFMTVARISEATTGKILYGAREIPVYLEPEDDLVISFDAKDMKKTLGLDGKAGKQIAFLVELANEFKNEDVEAKGLVFTSSAKTYKKFMDGVRRRKIEFLKKRLNDFSNSFNIYAKAEIDYWYAYHLANYRWEYPLQFDQLEPIEIKDKNFYKFMEEIPVSNAAALNNKYFQSYLEIFMSDQAEKDENLGLTELELADKYLTGETKDFFKARILSRKIKAGNLEPYLFHTKRFIEETPYLKYKETVKDALRSFSGVLTGMPAHNFSLKDKYGKSLNLSQFRGKVVYIDFWATWCQSCIHQMQNSGSLRERFGKDVVFLYISLDNRKEEWESYMRRTPMEGTHAFAEGALMGEVAKAYGVKKLPAVYLVDKNGKIAHSPAKLPNQAGIVQQIQDILDGK